MLILPRRIASSKLLFWGERRREIILFAFLQLFSAGDMQNFPRDKRREDEIEQGVDDVIWSTSFPQGNVRDFFHRPALRVSVGRWQNRTRRDRVDAYPGRQLLRESA